MTSVDWVTPYLQGLKINRDLAPVDLINLMIERHLTHYSFNNIDLLLDDAKILSLEIDDLHQKIIVRKRGGYCFEHNKLFFYLLCQLQIEIKPCLARVTYNQDIEVAQSHRVSIAKIDGQDYLVDVGFGAFTPNMMIAFSGTVQVAPNGREYRLKALSDDVFGLQMMKDGEFFTLYECSTAPCLEVDFDVANYYTNTHPDSKFTKTLSLAMNLEAKTQFINQKIFTILEGENKLETPVLSPQQFKDIVEQNFDIVLSDHQAIKLFEFI